MNIMYLYTRFVVYLKADMEVDKMDQLLSVKQLTYLLLLSVFEHN